MGDLYRTLAFRDSRLLSRLAQTCDVWKVRFALAQQFHACGLPVNGLQVLLQTIPDEIEGVNTLYVALRVPDPLNDGAGLCSGIALGDYRLAARKAFSEYLECLSWWATNPAPEETRSGWAAGATEAEATERAWAELVERDAFLTHFLCPDLKTDPLCLPDTVRDRRLRLVRLQSADPAFQVVAAGYQVDGPGYWLVGTGAARSETEALWKAVLECLMLKQAWERHGDRRREPRTRERLFRAHLEASTQSEGRGRLEYIFTAQGQSRSCFRAARDEFKLAHQRAFGTASVVVQGMHPRLIPLSLGSVWESSRDRVLAELARRGLRRGQWGTHPLL